MIQYQRNNNTAADCKSSFESTVTFPTTGTISLKKQYVQNTYNKEINIKYLLHCDVFWK